MPNVMGREFPYTAEGMAAAQQYEQAMGVRGGGMMGFRPVGMQGGGMMGQEAVVGGGAGMALNEVMKNVVDRFTAVTQAGTMEEVKKYAAENISDLMGVVNSGGPGSKFVSDTLQLLGSPVQSTNESPPLGSGVTTNPGFDPATNTYTPPAMAGGGIMSLRGY